jgi:hypothetical protein
MKIGHGVAEDMNTPVAIGLFHRIRDGFGFRGDGEGIRVGDGSGHLAAGEEGIKEKTLCVHFLKSLISF